GIEHQHEGCDRDHDRNEPGIAVAGRRAALRVPMIRFALVWRSIHRTRTRGMTDMPGPRCTSGASSKTIFTGTRWTTFTKLPVAFSGGSRLNAAPLPAWMLST